MFASNCKYYSTPVQSWNVSKEFQLRASSGALQLLSPTHPSKLHYWCLYFIDPPKHVTCFYAVLKRKTIGDKMRDMCRLIKLIWYGRAFSILIVTLYATTVHNSEHILPILCSAHTLRRTQHSSHTSTGTTRHVELCR